MATNEDLFRTFLGQVLAPVDQSEVAKTSDEFSADSSMSTKRHEYLGVLNAPLETLTDGELCWRLGNHLRDAGYDIFGIELSILSHLCSRAMRREKNV